MRICRLAGVAALVLAGCATPVLPRRAFVPAYRPANVFCHQPRLPEGLRRVAVLPLTAEGRDAASEAGRDTLEPLLGAELRKLKAFEVVFVSTEQVRLWTGQDRWQADEALPPAFFQKLREATGCDAVIFARLTAYRPYPPLAVGWSLKLVDGRKPLIWWSVDEVFDAGSAAVANAAESYGRAEMNLPSPLLDSSTVLTSPRRFGQYAAQAALATLPPR